MRLPLLTLLLALAGCARHQPVIVVRELPGLHRPTPVDQPPARTTEELETIHVAGFVDPSNPRLYHGPSTLTRVIRAPAWTASSPWTPVSETTPAPGSEPVLYQEQVLAQMANYRREQGETMRAITNAALAVHQFGSNAQILPRLLEQNRLLEQRIHELSNRLDRVTPNNPGINRP